MKLWFYNKTKFFVILSCVIILAGLVAGIIFGGLNLGIDFTGGSIFTVEMGTAFKDEDINAALSANGVDPAMAQIVHASTTANAGDEAVIRMQPLPLETDMKALRESIVSSLKAKYPNAFPGEIENIAGTTSGEIIANAFLSVIIASVLMLIYIWIRFTLYSGIAAVIALIHDVL
jgi:preprotein translocase subunit SecF